MGIFSDIKLEFDGKEYKIPADRVLPAIAVAEEHITLGDLATGARGRLPLARISQAFAAVLRYAGATVTDDEVYSALFTGDGRDLHQRVTGALFSLQMLMIPPEHLRAPVEKKSDGASGGKSSSKRRSGS